LTHSFLKEESLESSLGKPLSSEFKQFRNLKDSILHTPLNSLETPDLLIRAAELGITLKKDDSSYSPEKLLAQKPLKRIDDLKQNEDSTELSLIQQQEE